MLGLLWTILIGFVIGVVARFLMPGEDKAGFFVTALLGIVGSAVGGWLAVALGISAESGLGQFAVGVAGAVLLLFLYRLVIGRGARA